MVRGPEESWELLHRAEQLMMEGRVDEARPLIETLEKEGKLLADDRLTWQLLKSQLLITLGDFGTSLHLAKQVSKESQERDKPLQAIDAWLVIAEAHNRLNDHDESLNAIIQGEKLLATLTGEPPAALSQRQASLIHRRGRICIETGDFNQALEYFQQSLALRQKLGNKHDIAVSLRNIGVAYFEKGDIALGIEYHQQALKLFREVGNKYRIAWCLINIGGMSSNKGDMDQALEYSRQGLALYQELDAKAQIAYSLRIVGGIYHAKGDLERALEHYLQALPIAEEQGYRWENAGILNSIAVIYWNRGELEQALEFLRQGLAMAQEGGNKKIIAHSIGAIGLINWQKGELEQAIVKLEEAMSFFEDIGDNFTKATYLYWLVSVALDKGPREQAQGYLHRLQLINEQEENKLISQYCRLAEALVLKASPRIRDKVRAQELFQQVAEEEIFVHILTERAMVNLCELLLDELKAYGEIAVLQEAKTLVHRLYTLAQDRHSFSLTINALILQAKLSLIEGDLAAVTQLLEQARFTADENKLELLAKKVSRERDHLETQFETWRGLIQRNASFEERLKHARVADYLKDVEKLVSIETQAPSS
ncbi:MAG: tetratricopeptide repeat protein [Candidatus Heimdallarchaeota archaeon]